MGWIGIWELCYNWVKNVFGWGLFIIYVLEMMFVVLVLYCFCVYFYFIIYMLYNCFVLSLLVKLKGGELCSSNNSSGWEESLFGFLFCLMCSWWGFCECLFVVGERVIVVLSCEEVFVWCCFLLCDIFVYLDYLLFYY